MYSLVEELVKNNIITGDEIATNEVQARNNEVVISGNKMGLILLAEELLKIALQSESKTHIHLDENNFLDENSHELIICKNN